MKKYKTFRIMHWDQKQELWLPVKDYEGLYEVSNFGRVKSLKYDKERVLRAGKGKNGYLTVVLRCDGKSKSCYVHRLVAESFIPNPLGLPEVNHKDENPSSNYAENLEWCDRNYNNNYGTRTEKTCKSVLQLTRDGQLVREWPSTHEAERQGGYNHAHIVDCCSGKRNKHKGYRWVYKEEVA